MHGLKSVRRRHDDALSRVDWRQLETLLADHYRRQGYRVEHTGTGASGTRFDGGIDLKLWKDDAFILVQSKHWKTLQVPHNAVHELLGLMVNHGATGAILVSSGEFTPAAIEAANRQGHVQLIDGVALRAMLGPLPELAPDAQFSPSTAFGSPADYRPSRTRSHGRAERELNRIIGKLIGLAIGSLIMVFGLRYALTQLQRDLTSTHPAPRSAPAALPIEQARHALTSTRSAEPPQPLPSNEQDAARARARSDAELADWKRRNAESMKILEKTTPEAR